MNGPVWVGWVLVGVLAAISITFLMGKGSILISGYNTTSKGEKEKYDEKKLCRVMGVGFGIITIIMGIDLTYGTNLPNNIHWLTPWGYFIVIVVVAVLSNTVCRKREAP